MAELGFQAAPEVMNDDDLNQQARNLVNALVVYRAYKATDATKNWKRYAGILYCDAGSYSIKRATEYNYIPLTEPHHGAPQLVPFPEPGMVYTRLVRSSVFLTEYATFLQEQLQMAQDQARDQQGERQQYGRLGVGNEQFTWYDPTTWVGAHPRAILLELRAQLGVSEASPAIRRAAFAQLENIVWGTVPLQGWANTRAVDALAQQIRFLRDSIARDAGVDMVRLTKELAEEEEDPYRVALLKAGMLSKRGRGRGGRGGARRTGTCWTCGEVGHMSPDCPSTKAKEDAPAPKNRGRGGQH